MDTTISIAILAYITWLGFASAALNSTAPQKFTDHYQDNIALPQQQYKEVIMYLTPSQIRTLQKTQDQHGLIVPSPTAQPETPTDNDDRRNYFYANNANSEQDQPRYPSSSQQQYNNNNKYSDNREALYSDLKQRDSENPVAESTYAYRDQNSYVYNRIKTMFMQNDKYIAPKARNQNPQLKQYKNPQIPTTTTTEKPKAMEQQEGFNAVDWQAAYNFLQLDSAKKSQDTNSKESLYYRAQNQLFEPNKLPSFEQSTYDQKNAFTNFQPERFYPITNSQESRQTSEFPNGNQEPLFIPSNLDRDTQLIFQNNKYQLVPYYPEPKNKEEHTQLLQELLNQRIPDVVKASMFQNTQLQMPEKENYYSQYAPNYSNDGLLPEESQKILLRIMSHNMEANAKAEALNKIRKNTHKNVEAKANVEMSLDQPNQRGLPEESKKILQDAMMNNMESQAKVAAISNLPPIIISKEVKITKQTPLQWFNGKPVSQAVWWPASTVPEMNVPRVYQVPQEIIKPLGLPTLVRAEKVALDKQVVDLEKHFPALEQQPAESASSYYSEPRGLDKSASKDSLQKPKQLTIIKHVWTD